VWQVTADTHLELAHEALADGDIDGAVEHYAAAARIGDGEVKALAADLIRRADREDLAHEAIAWLESARDGSGAAEHVLGLYAFHGFGRGQDHVAALTLHEAAAARGHADAMFELYAMYAQGLGTVADGTRALAWCSKAAEAGNARAMANLGGFYATGNGVPRDLGQSVLWYDRAAQLGHGKAAATLGMMYALGDQLDPDTDKAREYLALAEDNGFDWRPLAAQLGVL
jgi:TPR repeat protein